MTTPNNIHPFEKRLELNAREKTLFCENETVCVALSGGCDSTVLLYAMTRIAPRMNITVCAAHLNHMIRGQEADNDEEHCRSLCENLGISLNVGRVDVLSEARREGKGIEETARRIRYDFLEESAHQAGATRILTAHNANDNAETVIMNLARGTGPQGLRGIPAVRGNISRPLLIFTRAEIEKYAADMSLTYVTDFTNADTDYTRNYIRRVVIPDLEKINPSVIEAINRLTRTLDYDALTQELIPACTAAGTGRITKRHIDAMTEAVKSGKSGMLSLPGKKTFIYKDGEYSFADADKTVSDVGFLPQKLVNGMNILSDGTIITVCSEKPEEGADFVFRTGTMFIDGELEVRHRAIGDTIRLNSMTKSIKKCFIDKKVPVALRDALPIICRDGKPVFVPFVGTDDTCRAGNNKTFYISIHTRKANQDR